MSMKSTRAAKVQSRPTSRAKSRHRIPRLIQEGLDTRLAHNLMSARAATMTAILALEGKGVEGEVATSLRIHVLHALERIESAVRDGGRLS